MKQRLYFPRARVSLGHDPRYPVAERRVAKVEKLPRHVIVPKGPLSQRIDGKEAANRIRFFKAKFCSCGQSALECAFRHNVLDFGA